MLWVNNIAICLCQMKMKSIGLACFWRKRVTRINKLGVLSMTSRLSLLNLMKAVSADCLEWYCDGCHLWWHCLEARGVGKGMDVSCLNGSFVRCREIGSGVVSDLDVWLVCG